MKKKKRRFVRGRDWHGWAWKCGNGNSPLLPNGLFYWAEQGKPMTRPTADGQWVRVRFVESDQ